MTCYSGGMPVFYITKYALTTGIIKARGRVCEPPSMIDIGKGQYFHGCDWHETMEAAESRVAAMITKKIASLRKQMALIDVIRLNGAKVEDRTI